MLIGCIIHRYSICILTTWVSYALLFFTLRINAKHFQSFKILIQAPKNGKTGTTSHLSWEYTHLSWERLTQYWNTYIFPPYACDLLYLSNFNEIKDTFHLGILHELHWITEVWINQHAQLFVRPNQIIMTICQWKYCMKQLRAKWNNSFLIS